MKQVTFKDLVNTVKEIANKQGDNYYHVSIEYAIHYTDWMVGEGEGLLYKAYTPKSGWVSALTIEGLVNALNCKAIERNLDIPIDIEAITEANV
jgi:hypothetical protein